MACLLILGVTGSPLQSAQAAVEDEQDAPDSEIREFLKNPRGGLLNPQLSPLDEHLLGDRIDIESGSLSFHQVDVDIPGNSDLPVRFARKRARHGDMDGIARGWDIDIPYISVRVPENHVVPGYENLETAWMAERCSGRVNTNGDTVLSPERFTYGGGTRVSSSSYWTGVKLNVNGSSQRIDVLDSTQEFSGTSLPKGITSSYWRVDCVGSVRNAFGEGFLITSPNGTTYKFDHLMEFDTEALVDMSPSAPLRVQSAVMFVTEVKDVHDNWVRYNYGPYGPTVIESNDARRIDISYDGAGALSRVTANGRVWTYTADNVTLPDGRKWTYQGLSALDWATRDEPMACRYVPGAGNDQVIDYNVVVTHPSGTVGRFDLEYIKHGRVGAPDSYNEYKHTETNPLYGDANDECDYHVSLNKAHHFSIGVTRKQLEIVGGDTVAWRYIYEEDDGNYLSGAHGDPNLSYRKKRDVIAPDGSKMVYFFNRFWDWREGKIYQTKTYSPSGALLETVQHEYTKGHKLASSHGLFVNGRNPDLYDYLSYKTKTTITRDGETYTTEYDFDQSPSSSTFAFSKPSIIRKFSTLGGGTRTTDLSYKHLKSDWILGLLTEVKRNGKLFDEYFYGDPTYPGKVTEHRRFGVKWATYDYWDDSTDVAGGLRYHTDAVGRTTEFRQWKRGIPQRIDRADGNSIYRSVDGNGWLVSQTDAMDVVTGYTYNSVGWLTKIDRPGSWADTTIYYILDDNGYGTMFADLRRGTFQEVTWYDGLHRPTLVRTKDSADNATESYVRMTYDAMGRLFYQSAPQTGSGTTAFGTETKYDALGRVTEVRENVSPYATTRTYYQSDNEIRVVDPVGNTTLTKRTGFGSPNDGQVSRILQYEGNQSVLLSRTDMSFDSWGNVLTARQRGNVRGYSEDRTQTYVYNNELRLCQHHTPEQGSKLFRYNAAGELTSYAEGQPKAGICGSMPGGATVYQSYTVLGQPDVTNYPSGTPDINRDYDRNGNIFELRRGSGDDLVHWSYRYHYTGTDDLLNVETLAIDGRTFSARHEMNPNGHHSAENTVGGLRVRHFVDALGRPSEATVSGGPAFADNVTYHPNGYPARYDLGNGRYYRSELNARQQVSRSIYSFEETGFDSKFSYDKNGRVLTIDDRWDDKLDRAFAYDGLGRLISAQGPWGTGSFEYDPVGNLRKKKLGDATVEIKIGGSNRVEQFRDTREDNVWQAVFHNMRGNTYHTGLHAYGGADLVYDHSNQPISVSVPTPDAQIVVADTLHLGGAAYTHTWTGNYDDGQPSKFSFIGGGEATVDIATKSWDSLFQRDLIGVEAGAKYRITADVKIEGTTQPRPGESGKYLALQFVRLDENYQKAEVESAAWYGFDSVDDGNWRTYTVDYVGKADDLYLRARVYRRTILDGTGKVHVRNFRVERIVDSVSTATYTYDGNMEGAKSLAATFEDGPSAFILRDFQVSGGKAHIDLSRDDDGRLNLAETVPLVPGATYTVEVETRTVGDYIPPHEDGTFNIHALGSSQQLVGGTPTSDGWSKRELTFTASTSATELDFYIWRNGDWRGNATLEFRNLKITSPQVAAPGGGGTSISYTYDGNMKRVKSVEGGVTTYFVYGLSGQLLHKRKVEAGQAEEATDYISIAGKPLARVTNGKTTYVYRDHLGSNSVLADDQGNVIAREVLTPYGELWAGASAANDNNPTFTGHVRDTSTGLTYMQARYYEPVLGRFLATDPVQFAPGRPEYFNRYTYAGNDPVNMWDPDGEFFMGVIFGLGTEGLVQIAQNFRRYGFNTNAYEWDEDGFKMAAALGLVGGVGGKLFGSAIAGGMKNALRSQSSREMAKRTVGEQNLWRNLGGEALEKHTQKEVSEFFGAVIGSQSKSIHPIGDWYESIADMLVAQNDDTADTLKAGLNPIPENGVDDGDEELPSICVYLRDGSTNC